MRRMVWVVAIVTSSACGSARIVSHDPTGGIIELQGETNKAMDAANEQMAEHCGADNFWIVQEDKNLVGSKIVWRVRYACGARPAPAPAPAPSP